MNLSKDNQNCESVRKTAPLRNFILSKEERNEHASSETSSTIRDRRNQRSKASASRPNTSTECCYSSPQGSGSNRRVSHSKTTKSRSSVRHRKSKTHRSHSAKPKPNKVPNLKGFCTCGAKVSIIFGDLCENCYADFAQRWSGKSQRAEIVW